MFDLKAFVNDTLDVITIASALKNYQIELVSFGGKCDSATKSMRKLPMIRQEEPEASTPHEGPNG